MVDTTYLALAEGTNTDTPGDVFGVWSKPLSRELSFGRYVHVRCQEPYAPILTDPKILQRLEIGNSKSPIHPDALLQSEQFLLGKDSILAKPRWPLRLQAGGLLYLVGGYPGYILTIARTDGARLGALAGHSNSLEEIAEPRDLLLREGSEEALIVYNGRHFILGYPNRSSCTVGEDIYAPKFVDCSSLLSELKINFYDKDYLIEDFSERSRFNADFVNHEVNTDGDISLVRFFCTVSWDPSTAGLDYIRTVDLRSKIQDLEKLALYDSECDSFGQRLHRDHVLIPLDVLSSSLQRSAFTSDAQSLGRHYYDPTAECLVMNGFSGLGVQRKQNLRNFKLGTTLRNIFFRWRTVEF